VCAGLPGALMVRGVAYNALAKKENIWICDAEAFTYGQKDRNVSLSGYCRNSARLTADSLH